MATFTLSKPQHRKRVHTKWSAHFPVPIGEQFGLHSSGNQWHFYTAYLFNNTITVTHSGDMENLYKMGFFGKGTLSRHKPTFHSSAPFVRWFADGQDRERSLQIMSRRRYIQRLNWSQEQMAGVDDILPVAKKKKLLLCEGKQECSQKKEMIVEGLTEDETRLVAEDDFMVDVNRACGGSPAEDWASVTEQEAMDIWGIPQQQSQQTSAGYKQSPVVNKPDALSEPDEVSKPDTISKPNEVSKPYGVSKPDGVSKLDSVSKLDVASKPDAVSKPDAASKLDAVSYLQCMSTQMTNFMESKESSPIVKSVSQTDNHMGPSKDRTSISTDTCCTSTSLNQTLRKSEIVSYLDKSGDELCNLDSRCLLDEDDADFLVVDDTDDSDADTELDTRRKWQVVVKQNPLHVKEDLQLSMEETFFLAYGLGCLVLLDEKHEALDILAMWQLFCARDINFLQRYIVYHNFRSKGWVPKSGLKFGTDFVVYKKGPAYYHSTYSVIVRLVSSSELREVHTGITREHSWTSLAALNRVTEQVCKDLMLCYVIKPDSLRDEDCRSPECISKFKVQEVILKRSVSKQEREHAEYIQIP